MGIEEHEDEMCIGNRKPKIVPSVLFNFKLFKDVVNGVNNDKGDDV